MTAADLIEATTADLSKLDMASNLPLQKHKLKRSWTYWYLNDNRMVKWEDRLKKINTFTSVEDFWALYNNIKLPSQLNNTCDYNVFKEGIEPMWEVPQNANGGRWLINIEKSRAGDVMDIIWLEILIAMIGEQFGDDQDLICGLVANIRAKGSKISVWTSDHNNDEGNMRIGRIIRAKLLSAPVPDKVKQPIFDVLRYEDHNSTQTKTGSSVKPKLTLNAVEEARQ